MKIELLYTVWNRLEFTKKSFGLLKQNTNWDHVSRLIVYDDGSVDGAREWVTEAGLDIPVEGFEVRTGGWHSTGATMNDFIALTEAEAFVKVDNDICMPPGWLDILLVVAERNPDYELIGVEAGWTGSQKPRMEAELYKIESGDHIGGVGLMRTEAFTRRRPIPLSLGKNGRAGFTIWQHKGRLMAGWVKPDLEVVQLDRIPEEPWITLSKRYVEEGWARRWDPYARDMHRWWDWIKEER